MFFSRFKISTKLIVSSAVFLIPVGIMLFFIYSGTMASIRKNLNEQSGIGCLRPAAVLMEKLSRYLNVYLGLETGDLSRLDEEIGGAIKSLDRELAQWRRPEGSIPDLAEAWEAFKKMPPGDDGIYQACLDFALSVQELIGWIGERSTLILVSDMRTYYFINTALSALPEASVRLISTGNVLRAGLVRAEANVERWNAELADAQAQGRRLTQAGFTSDPKDITVMMLPSEDWQVIINNRPLFEADSERVKNSLTLAMEEGGGAEELAGGLDGYLNAAAALSEQYGRIFGFNISNPATAAECLEGISKLNAGAAGLWTAILDQLDGLVRYNTGLAQKRLALYLAVALISVLLAFAFVAVSTLDINRSVRSLKTLFKGLNENDLTLSLEVNSQDEFGELMTAFNGFLNILRSTFGSFKQSAQLVATSVFDLSSSSKEITTTANEQSASVSEIVSTMESSKNLSEQIAVKTTEVARLAAETQELSSKGAELREANQGMMEDIRQQNQKIISEIRNLSDMIIRISEAIRIIDGIADQTKLIAFNASLEASSSGESGARFSVVAAEIRRFADNVVESTREIKQKIEEVQGASQTLIAEANSGSRQIELGYERMSEQKIVFEHIVENSQNVATRSQQISNLSKQQELASSQIFNALKEISAGVKQFVIATSSTSKIADSLNGMSEELKEKVEEYRTAT
ncbi:MAG: methyl-accepting chemotaxis protein [Spirochaetaceae bacterium]|jgi:methyl-accepting chemotaxis protein|nr:methyl-accepting chemotaxis protein [Spirochaetaceae bacterium]